MRDTDISAPVVPTVACEWRLYRLPWGAKAVFTLYLLVIGVGLLFALEQTRNRHGTLTLDNVTRHFYGPQAARDSIDAYWKNAETALVARWKAGERGATTSDKPSASTGALTLDDLDAFGEQEQLASQDAPFDDLLRAATSEENLRNLVRERHETDLGAKLGLPSEAQLVSLGHTHMFGRAAFFLPIALILLCTWFPWRTKTVFALVPLVGVLIDYPAQILARFVAPEFAILIIASGALMGIGFVLAFALGFWELWFRRT